MTAPRARPRWPRPPRRRSAARRSRPIRPARGPGRWAPPRGGRVPAARSWAGCWSQRTLCPSLMTPAPASAAWPRWRARRASGRRPWRASSRRSPSSVASPPSGASAPAPRPPAPTGTGSSWSGRSRAAARARRCSRHWAPSAPGCTRSSPTSSSASPGRGPSAPRRAASISTTRCCDCWSSPPSAPAYWWCSTTCSSPTRPRCWRSPTSPARWPTSAS